MKPRASGIKAVFFDLGGVCITEDCETVAEKYERLFGTPKKRFLNAFHRTYRKAYNRGTADSSERFKKLRMMLKLSASAKKLEEENLGAMNPVSRILKLVKRVRKKRKVFALSNLDRKLKKKLAKQGFFENFDGTILSCDYGAIKPYKRIYLIALRKARARPEECVFIDNHESRLAPARKLGMKTILFKNVAQLEKDLNALLTKESQMVPGRISNSFGGG